MYKEKKFSFGSLEGLSKEQVDLHLGLYSGYISKVNALYEQIDGFSGEENILIELRRRLSFELAGVYNHELYFSMLEGGSASIVDGALKSCIEKCFGSFDSFMSEIKRLALGARGIGWVIANYDKERELINLIWVEDHELGNISLPAILAVDMWEHAYLIDYKPADKSKYIDAYLNLFNWEKCSERFDSLN